MTAPYTLYSDFNCPFCYAMHERLHEMNLLALCEWRGVQHASHLPRPMKPWQGSLGVELRHEVTVVQRLAPGLPIALPPGKPNTRPAIEQSVALLRRDRSHMMTFVRETYRAFWCAGRDISDLGVLRHLVEQVGGSPESMGTINDEDRRVAQEWESAWHVTGQAGVPSLSRRRVISLSAAHLPKISGGFSLNRIRLHPNSARSSATHADVLLPCS
jgi:predicted DsbA family dithiol-disulfide isomerase